MGNEIDINHIFEQIKLEITRLNKEKGIKAFNEHVNDIKANLERVKLANRTYLLTDAFIFYVVVYCYDKEFSIFENIWETMNTWLQIIATCSEEELAYYFTEYAKFFMNIYNNHYDYLPDFYNDGTPKPAYTSRGTLYTDKICELLSDEDLLLFKKLFTYHEVATLGRNDIKGVAYNLFSLIFSYQYVRREYDSIENMLIKAIYNKEELCNKLALDGVITSYDISHLNLNSDGIKTYVSYVIDAIGIDSFKKID